MKKALSLILAVLMVVTAVPLSGMATVACEHDYDYYPGRTGKHTYYCTLCEDEGIEDCTGGTATCASGKICEKCNAVYTSATAHSYTKEEIADKYLATEGDCRTLKTYYKSCVTCSSKLIRGSPLIYYRCCKKRHKKSPPCLLPGRSLITYRIRFLTPVLTGSSSEGHILR